MILPKVCVMGSSQELASKVINVDVIIYGKDGANNKEAYKYDHGDDTHQIKFMTINLKDV